MAPQGAEVFKVDLDVRAPAGSGRTAHAHYNHTLRQIRRLELSQIQVAQLKFKVCEKTLSIAVRIFPALLQQAVMSVIFI